MTEQLAANPFTIEAATEADVAGIGQAHYRSMLENYPSAEAGIDKEWIEEYMRFLIEPEGDKYRRGTVKRAESDPDHELYLVVKDTDDDITGFCHATKTNQQGKLEALYLTSEAQGSGVGDELMARSLEFTGELPVVLQVLDSNQRAISFYEKYGFRAVPDSNAMIKEKLPVHDMLRPAPESEQTGAPHEV